MCTLSFESTAIEVYDTPPGGSSTIIMVQEDVDAQDEDQDA